MSDGEVEAGYEKSEYGRELINGLPPWMDRDHDSGNFKLLDVVGREVDRMVTDIDGVDNASTVQQAESIDQLRKLADLVDLPSKDGEGLEKYRSRSMAEFQKLTAESTPSEILNNTAVLLDVDVENIIYEKLEENGAVSLDLPRGGVDNSPLTGQEIGDIISEQAAAGFRVDVKVLGTFTYLAESAYSGPYDSANGGYDATQLNSNAEKGYDGLDSNDDPKGNGGTYSGLV